MIEAGWLTRRAAVWGSLASLAACQPPPPPATEPRRVGFMVFRTAINPESRDFFTADCDRMIAKGATEIRIGIRSPGGIIVAAESMMTYMDRMNADHGITFITFAVGMVASAACYVFLAGQKRYAIPTGVFLFHEAGMEARGRVTANRIYEAAASLGADESHFLDILQARTRLTRPEALSFVRRTVILDADEAQRDGLIDGVQVFVVPNAVTPSDIRAKSDTTPLPVTRLPAPPPAT